MMSNSDQAGYYGKLPLRGDFIQRNIDTDFIQFWDNWLQSVISSSREILGDKWLNFYLVSPIWQFYLPLENETAYCGIMLPSVDKVGRYFPFTIMNRVDYTLPAQTIMEMHENWFDEAEYLAFQALEENISLEQLNEAIDSLNQTEIPLVESHVSKSIHNYRIPFNSKSKIKDAMQQLNQVLPQTVSNKYNYWWTIGNDTIAGNFFFSDIMPNDNIYTAMLDGQWQLCHIQSNDTQNNITPNEHI